MLDVLDRALRDLPDLLSSDAGWASMDVTYHAPRVERIYRDYGPGRLLLHCMHPCGVGEALYHPHPWPSAVRIVLGTYEMGISSTFEDEDGEIGRHLDEGPAWTTQHAKMVIGAGARYEMVDPDGWHYVRPLGVPAYSVMVTGELYTPVVPMPSPPSDPQKPLSATRFDELMSIWRTLL